MKKLLQRDELSRYVSDGLRAAEIAELCGVSHITVCRACDAYGLPRPITKTKALLAPEALEELRGAGLHVDEIAAALGCSSTTVRRSCNRFGIKVPCTDAHPRARTKQFNTRFFQELDSEEKAYALGFISADGGLDRNWGIKIALHPKDENVLVKLAKAMQCDYAPRLVEGGSRIMLALYDIDMIADIRKYGIVQRKTATLTFATNVPDNLIRHYMRGVFDGDGTVSNKPPRFVTGSEPFYTGFMAWFSRMYGRTPWSSCEGGRKWRVVFSWLKHRQFMDDMYGDATIALDRKHDSYKAKVKQ